MSRKENKQGAPAGGPGAQGDVARSAGLHFLTPQPVGLIGMIRESSTNRAVRPLGLCGGCPPPATPCINGSPPGRGRAPVVANMVAWYRGLESHVSIAFLEERRLLPPSFLICKIGGFSNRWGWVVLIKVSTGGLRAGPRVLQNMSGYPMEP